MTEFIRGKRLTLRFPQEQILGKSPTWPVLQPEATPFLRPNGPGEEIQKKKTRPDEQEKQICKRGRVSLKSYYWIRGSYNQLVSYTVLVEVSIVQTFEKPFWWCVSIALKIPIYFELIILFLDIYLNGIIRNIQCSQSHYLQRLVAGNSLYIQAWENDRINCNLCRRWTIYFVATESHFFFC